MRSPSSLRTKRISSFLKFRLLPPKDFFDSIDPSEKSVSRNFVFYAADLTHT
jgi:hypothetical protein